MNHLLDVILLFSAKCICIGAAIIAVGWFWGFVIDKFMNYTGFTVLCFKFFLQECKKSPRPFLYRCIWGKPEEE